MHRHLVASFASLLLILMPLAAAAAPLPTSGKTPIATLAKDPMTREVLDAYLPGVQSHPKYFDFQWLTPRELKRFDPRITDDALAQMDKALAATRVPPSVETTPIFLLAARPETRAVLETYLPGMLQHPNYPKFRYISLKALQGFDPRISDEALGVVQAELEAAGALETSRSK